MSKFKCFHQSSSGSSKNCFATVSTIEEAARKCDDYVHGERDHECYNAIIERGFYMIGYGPSEVSVEEV